VEREKEKWREKSVSAVFQFSHGHSGGSLFTKGMDGSRKFEKGKKKTARSPKFTQKRRKSYFGVRNPFYRRNLGGKLSRGWVLGEIILN